VPLLLALLAAPAATAQAATYCVGLDRPGCTGRSSAAAAFESARADSDLDTILLGRIAEAGPFADAPGRPVRVVGLGAQTTTLRAAPSGPALRLADGGSSAAALRVEGAAGPALQLDAGGSVRSAVLGGRLLVRGGSARLDSVAVSTVGRAVEVSCEQAATVLDAHHITVAGAGESGVTVACGVADRDALVRVADSIVWGFDRAFAIGARATVVTRFSDYPGAAGLGDVSVDPGFAGGGDLRLRPGSPLVDAGRPGRLEDEPHEDALGFLRAAAGRGDGIARRDMGAFELQPDPPSIAGNLLTNGGAEAGTPAADDRASPAPPAWSRTGAFTFVRYGTVAGEFAFPGRRVGEALDAGDAFFAAGPAGQASATQVADLSPWAPEIDLRAASAELSALLGGYRASADGAVVEAEFRDPAGRALGSTRIGPVTPDERAGATAFAHRSATVAIPPLTRTVAVTMRSTPPAGRYDDAYFDRVALIARVGGAPAPDPPEADGARPYAGVALLSPRAAVDRRRRAWLRLGCPSATAGGCSGAVTLRARGRTAGARPFALRPGRRALLAVALAPGMRRALRSARRVPGRLFLATRDGQGLTRATTAPLRIVRGARYGARAASHSAGSAPAGMRPG
jgi:hypothetical protein